MARSKAASNTTTPADVTAAKALAVNESQPGAVPLPELVDPCPKVVPPRPVWAEPGPDAPRARRYRVIRGAQIGIRGMVHTIRSGIVVDSLNYNIEDLEAQGVVLQKIEG